MTEPLCQIYIHVRDDTSDRTVWELRKSMPGNWNPEVALTTFFEEFEPDELGTYTAENHLGKRHTAQWAGRRAA